MPIRPQITVGSVIAIRACTDDGTIHDKFYIVVHVGAEYVTCIVNTRPAPFIESRPKLKRCQVLMEQPSHQFMKHDSWVDCSKVIGLDADTVRTQVDLERRRYRGKITAALRDRISGAMRVSAFIAPGKSKVYCASLAAAQLD